MYTTNLVDACYHCLDTSKANIAVVEDSKQLEKILEIKSTLPHLKAIIQYEGKPTVEGVLSVRFHYNHNNSVHNNCYKYSTLIVYAVFRFNIIFIYFFIFLFSSGKM